MVGKNYIKKLLQIYVFNVMLIRVMTHAVSPDFNVLKVKD